AFLVAPGDDHQVALAALSGADELHPGALAHQGDACAQAALARLRYEVLERTQAVAARSGANGLVLLVHVRPGRVQEGELGPRALGQRERLLDRARAAERQTVPGQGQIDADQDAREARHGQTSDTATDPDARTLPRPRHRVPAPGRPFLRGLAWRPGIQPRSRSDASRSPSDP